MTTIIFHKKVDLAATDKLSDNCLARVTIVMCHEGFMPPLVLSRRNSIFTVFGICLIALAVFGWGLQYKMSLYRASGDHRAAVPSAKLLPPKEAVCSVQTAIMSAPDQPSPVPLSVAFVATIFSALQLNSDRQLLGSSRNSPSRVNWYFGSVFFSFRPPPSGAFAA